VRQPRAAAGAPPVTRDRELLARILAPLQASDPSGLQRRLRDSAAPATALLVVTVWLLTIAGGAWNILHSRTEILREARTTVGNLAALLAQDVRGRLDACDMLISGLVERLETDGATASTIGHLESRFDERMALLPGLHMIAVVDADGRFLLSADPARARTLNVRDRDYFAYHASHAQGARYISLPFASRFDGRWLIAVSRRWNLPDGRFGGVVIATTDLTEMEARYRPLNLGRGGAVSVWMPPGVAVARVPRSPDLIGRFSPTAGPRIAQALAAGSGSAIFPGSGDGVERLYAFRRIDGYEMVQYVGLSLAEILVPWQREVRNTIAVAIGVVLVTGFLGIHLIRLIGRRADERTAYRLLADNATDMILCLDTRFIRRYVSPACRDILGYAPEELVGLSPLEVSHPDDLAQMRAAFEAVLAGAERRSTNNRIRHKDGRWVWVDVQLKRIVSPRGQVLGIIGALRDAGDRHAAEQALHTANRHLAALANSDGLTGLANRRHFDAVLDQEIARARRAGLPLALILLDVDRFKAFNDHYGHPAGDRCLRLIADTVAAMLQRPSDLAARYGGEEMAVILPETCADGARRVAERIGQAVRAAAIPHAAGIGGIVSVSIGIAAVAAGGPAAGDGAALISAADRALYAAKAAGRARIEVAAAV
jgi:diguanylate cyclase (GGDEF)-like protein/PAS domain S-box-containing protein